MSGRPRNERPCSSRARARTNSSTSSASPQPSPMDSAALRTAANAPSMRYSGVTFATLRAHRRYTHRARTGRQLSWVADSARAAYAIAASPRCGATPPRIRLAASMLPARPSLLITA
eukprot:6005904-Prymnesium_polylepis.2